MIRMETGAPGRSSLIFLSGKTGVISSKFRRLGVVSGTTVTISYTTLDALNTITIFLSPAEPAA